MVEPKVIDRRKNPGDASFTLPVCCQNCDFKGNVKISKGEDSSHTIKWTECPNCGVDGYRALQRSFRTSTPESEVE